MVDRRKRTKRDEKHDDCHLSSGPVANNWTNHRITQRNRRVGRNELHFSTDRPKMRWRRKVTDFVSVWNVLRSFQIVWVPLLFGVELKRWPGGRFTNKKVIMRLAWLNRSFTIAALFTAMTESLRANYRFSVEGGALLEYAPSPKLFLIFLRTFIFPLDGADPDISSLLQWHPASTFFFIWNIPIKLRHGQIVDRKLVEFFLRIRTVKLPGITLAEANEFSRTTKISNEKQLIQA